MARTLVVAPSWVGDAVLSHPLLVRLKERDPAGRIDVLAPPWVLAAYRRMPEVSQAIAQPFGHGDLKLGERRAFAKSLGAYDEAIVLPNSWKSALIPWHAGIERRTGYIGEMRYGLLNDARALDKEALPLIVERFAALAQPAREPLRRPLPQPRLAVDEAMRRSTLRAQGLEADRPITVMAPGAEYGPAKRWPARHFAELATILAARGDRISHVLIENRMQDFFFALEIEIDGAIGHVRRAGDVGNFGIEIAVARKDAGGRTQNQFALARRSVSTVLSDHLPN